MYKYIYHSTRPDLWRVVHALKINKSTKSIHNENIFEIVDTKIFITNKLNELSKTVCILIACSKFVEYVLGEQIYVVYVSGSKVMVDQCRFFKVTENVGIFSINSFHIFTASRQLWHPARCQCHREITKLTHFKCGIINHHLLIKPNEFHKRIHLWMSRASFVCS